MMTGVLAQLEPSSSAQLFAGVLMSVAAFGLVLRLRPYLSDKDNWLAAMSYAQLFLVLVCSLMMKSQKESGEDFDGGAVGVLLIDTSLSVRRRASEPFEHP